MQVNEFGEFEGFINLKGLTVHNRKKIMDDHFCVDRK